MSIDRGRVCPFPLHDGADPGGAMPAERLHVGAALFHDAYGDADGAGGFRVLSEQERFAMLRDAVDLANRAANVMRLAVIVARDHGATWGEVGAGLGITRQGAQQQYGR